MESPTRAQAQPQAIYLGFAAYSAHQPFGLILPETILHWSGGTLGRGERTELRRQQRHFFRQLRKRFARAVRRLNRHDKRDHGEYRDEGNHATLHGVVKGYSHK